MFKVDRVFNGQTGKHTSFALVNGEVCHLNTYACGYSTGERDEVRVGGLGSPQKRVQYERTDAVRVDDLVVVAYAIVNVGERTAPIQEDWKATHIPCDGVNIEYRKKMIQGLMEKQGVSV